MADEASAKPRLPILRLALVFVGVVLGAVVGGWPCLVYRSGDLITMASTRMHIVAAAITLYRDQNQGAYPPGAGRGLFTALRPFTDVEFEAVHYTQERKTIAQALLDTFAHTHHGRYEWLPFGPIPRNEPFRGPKRPLAEIAAQGRKDAVICAVALRLRDGSREVVALTIAGDETMIREGERGFDDALAATTEDETR